MSNLISVLEMLNNKELSTKYINYPFNYGKIVLEAKECGVSMPQALKTEMNLGWKLCLLPSNEVVLISDATRQKLILSGKKGYIYGKKFLERYARLYSNCEIGTKGEALSTELYYFLPHYILKTKEEYWLNDRYRNKCSSGLYAANQQELFQVGLWNMIRGKEKGEKSIRVVIHNIPIDAKIDISNPKKDGSTPIKAMDIII